MSAKKNTQDMRSIGTSRAKGTKYWVVRHLQLKNWPQFFKKLKSKNYNTIVLTEYIICLNDYTSWKKFSWLYMLHTLLFLLISYTIPWPIKTNKRTPLLQSPLHQLILHFPLPKNLHTKHKKITMRKEVKFFSVSFYTFSVGKVYHTYLGPRTLSGTAERDR